MITQSQKSLVSLIGLVGLLVVVNSVWTHRPATRVLIGVTCSRTAVIEAVQGLAERWDSTDARWASVALGQRLEVGDRVRTGAGSFITFRFTDGALLRLAPDSEITFTDHDGPPARLLARMGVALAQGWAMLSGEIDATEVETPTGVASVRG